MRRLCQSLALLPLAACLQIGTGPDSGLGGGGGSGGTASGSSSGSATASGAGRDAGLGVSSCGHDPQTGVVLCSAIDACPGLALDPAVFPGCGFQPHAGSVIDIECLCVDALCPVGVPTTCAQARTLIEGQSALLVCQQASEGRCVGVSTRDAGSPSTGTCDRACESTCGGEPSCMQLCGC